MSHGYSHKRCPYIFSTIAHEQAKLSQRDLSEKTGIKQSAIARIEKRRCSPSASTLIKLLVPMGYTLRIVPINEKKNDK